LNKPIYAVHINAVLRYVYSIPASSLMIMQEKNKKCQ